MLDSFDLLILNIKLENQLVILNKLVSMGRKNQGYDINPPDTPSRVCKLKVNVMFKLNLCVLLYLTFHMFNRYFTNYI